MVNPQLQNAARALHDLGIATWFGGQVFGKFALNPVVGRISNPRERGKVANSGWFSFNPIGFGGLAVADLVHLAARRTEMRDANLGPIEGRLVRAESLLLATSTLLTIATGVQGARLARQAPGGAVPIKTGTRPLRRTPPKAAALQRSIETLGNGNLLAGVGVVTVHALHNRLAQSSPPPKRGLRTFLRGER
jgi:hypothetical protein